MGEMDQAAQYDLFSCGTTFDSCDELDEAIDVLGDTSAHWVIVPILPSTNYADCLRAIRAGETAKRWQHEYRELLRRRWLVPGRNVTINSEAVIRGARTQVYRYREWLLGETGHGEPEWRKYYELTGQLPPRDRHWK